MRCQDASQPGAGTLVPLILSCSKSNSCILQRKNRGDNAIQMPLPQPAFAPEGQQLFLIFVDGGPQPPRETTSWKLVVPGAGQPSAAVTSANTIELSGHIDSMIRQGVQQRVVFSCGAMHSIDLRLATVTNLSGGITSRLAPEKTVVNVPPHPYKCAGIDPSFVSCSHFFAGNGLSQKIPCSSTCATPTATMFTLPPVHPHTSS